MEKKFDELNFSKLLKNSNEQLDYYQKFQKNELQLVERLKNIRGIDASPLYQIDQSEEFKLQIIPDKMVAPALFIPTLDPKKYKAHPTTIRALKKNIFTGGDEFIDLECIINCSSCKRECDLQFWHFCPYCEKSF